MKNKIVFSLAIMIAIILITHSCYAAVEIVPSKTNGTDAIVNTTISNSYLLCQGMTGTGETLQGSTVKPHLATNKDWGAVSYLSNSIYGTNTQGKNTGIEVTMNNVKYYSTTSNITGVMNWGRNPNIDIYTQTSGIIKEYMDLEDTSSSSAQKNVYELEKNAKNNSNYVEIFNTKYDGFNEKNDGTAMSEINIFSFVDWKAASNNKNNPISIRKGLFGYWLGASWGGSPSIKSTGAAYSDITFRPVVWN